MEILDLTPKNDLETLLSDYGKPAEVEQEKNETVTETENNQPGKVTTSENWRGNPDYFQTGKKAGQLKPKRSGPKVSYNASQAPASISGDLITGAMFLALVNLLMPMLIAGAHNYFTKKKSAKLKWSDIALTKSQENQLAPIADMAAKQVTLQWSPTAVLVISMFGLYAMQYAIARMGKEMEG